MNILFITLVDIRSIDEHNLYADLMREFAKNGHEVYIVSPTERRNNMKSQMIGFPGEDWHRNVHILKIKTGNIQKTNIIEKGISTVLMEGQIVRGIKRYLSDVKIDLVLYSTPPITIVKPIKYLQKRDHAKTYLMLKDIFPQNAVDLGMMSTTGIKGLLYRFFRAKEKELYEISNRIGCMSQANVDYVLKHNPEISAEKVEICPNSIEVQDMTLSDAEKTVMREKYGIPLDKKVFVYGGNLGKPQGIPFLIECLKSQENNPDAFFLIVGSGTEYPKLEAYVNEYHPTNVKLMQRLPKDDYDKMIAACDVGMIFLDHRFSIPNFPSRLLAYMQAGLPVLACTDPNTDVGKVITEGDLGWWCESNNVKEFIESVDSAQQNACKQGKCKEYLLAHFSSNKCYQIILNSMVNV